MLQFLLDERGFLRLACPALQNRQQHLVYELFVVHDFDELLFQVIELLRGTFVEVVEHELCLEYVSLLASRLLSRNDDVLDQVKGLKPFSFDFGVSQHAVVNFVGVVRYTLRFIILVY